MPLHAKHLDEPFLQDALEGPSCSPRNRKPLLPNSAGMSFDFGESTLIAPSVVIAAEWRAVERFEPRALVACP